MTNQIHAGWYPDPTCRHEVRYFDQQWTEHVATRGVNAIDPLTATPKSKIAIIGGVMAVVVAVAITLVMSLPVSGGGHGFCADEVALHKQYSAETLAVDIKTHNVSELSGIASQFDTMAAETSSPQNAADLRYASSWLRKVARGDYAAARAGQAHLAAASNRVNTYIDETCPGLYVEEG